MQGNYQTELKSWLIKLEILQQENVLLKNKVVDILKNDVDSSAVDRVESYLASFIEKDAVLALLRRDVANEMKSAGYYPKAEAREMMEKKHAGLCKDIAQMELEFHKLKAEFNDYLSRFIHAA